MMKAYRVELNGWTASFRHPQLVSGTQPSLPVPPPSTIYGLVAAAVGQWVDPADCQLAYVFQHQGTARDLETVYQFSNSARAKSNVIWREWLTDWQLWLYFVDKKWAQAFDQPVYPLLLGRQQELACVTRIEEVNLEQRSTYLRGTAVPFPLQGAAGMLLALPTVLSPEIPRRPLGVRTWHLVHRPCQLEADELYHDPELDHGVYLIGGS
ncbi:MAG: type I-B CRISPR-associated protein Cas5b [Candidatus Bipolaricaulia bacterium]